MHPCFAADSDILTPQSSQYDFNTIEAAQTSFRGVISSVKVDFGRLTRQGDLYCPFFQVTIDYWGITWNDSNWSNNY